MFNNGGAAAVTRTQCPSFIVEPTAPLRFLLFTCPVRRAPARAAGAATTAAAAAALRGPARRRPRHARHRAASLEKNRAETVSRRSSSLTTRQTTKGVVT